MAGSETEVLAPTPKQVDALIAEYAAAQSKAMALSAVAKISSDAAGEIKVRLTAMVEQWGGRHTEKSKRLAGLHNTATTTTATRVSIDDGAVNAFWDFAVKSEIPDLASRFFIAHTSYSLVSGPDELLKTMTMGTRIRTKITAMLKGCFEIKTNAPSLKVDCPEQQETAA
jgi:glutamine synthetase type III